MANQVLGGVARIDISPPAGITQGIWAAQTHQRAIGVDMPLYATSLVLQQRETITAIVDVDLLGFEPHQAQRIRDEVRRQTGIPAAAVRLCASHAHSGPNYFRQPLFNEGLDLLESYMGALPKRIAASVWEAQRKLTPVHLGFGSGSCAIATNRRAKLADGRVVVGINPDGVVDPTVRVVRLANSEGATLATLFHYSCHPTVLAWDNQYVAPDYPGPARREVERATGALSLFLQGAAGNIGPIEGYTGDLSVYRRLGRALGLEAASVALQIQAPPRRPQLVNVLESGASIAVYRDELDLGSPVLQVTTRSVELPRRQDLPDLESAEATERHWFERLENARKGAPQQEVRETLVAATRAWATAQSVRQHGGKTHLTWEIHAVTLGSCALIGVPGEPFLEVGLEIARHSPFPMTLFSGYTNGGLGYLPVASAFEEGGYEVEASPFEPEAASIVVRERLALLRALHAGATQSTR